MDPEISKELGSATLKSGWMDRNGQNILRFLHQPGISLKLKPDTWPEFANCSQIYQILNPIKGSAQITSLTGSLCTAAGTDPFTQTSHGRSNSAPDFQDF